MRRAGLLRSIVVNFACAMELPDQSRPMTTFGFTSHGTNAMIMLIQRNNDAICGSVMTFRRQSNMPSLGVALRDEERIV